MAIQARDGGMEGNGRSRRLGVAAVQMDVELGRPERNLERMLGFLAETALAGAHLTVFPECALTGYCFDSENEARAHAEPIPGPSTDRIAAACKDLGIHAIFGLLEADGARLFNAAVLVGPRGLAGKYRKVHLPYLGVDRFTDLGDLPLEVFEAGPLRVGMLICYDASFPEPARIIALDGADLIALPTNWPPGGELTAAHVIPTRALENNVYFIAANRVGDERGFQFIGQSKICHPSGAILTEAAHAREEVLHAGVDPEVARAKWIVRVPGKHEIDRFADRRPEFYGRIAEER